MRKDLIMRPLDFTSSFLSCENDLEKILKKLFLQSEPYSTELKKLLVINTKDALEDSNNLLYNKLIKDMTLAKLKEQGYIRWEPKIQMQEHEKVKTYLMFSFDNFFPNAVNPQFRDCVLVIDIICNSDQWDLGGFKIRPLKICGYIDAILNHTKLSGIGTFQFQSCVELILDENLAGYSLIFNAIHGTDDLLPSRHGWIEKTDQGWNEISSIKDQNKDNNTNNG